MSSGILKWKLCINASRFHVCFYVADFCMLLTDESIVRVMASYGQERGCDRGTQGGCGQLPLVAFDFANISKLHKAL
jgi:hypothetical protein